MEGLDFWRLCDDLTVVQAALLIIGTDPSGTEDYIHDWEPHKRPDGYAAVLAALKAAVLLGKISCTIRRAARDVAWIEALPHGESIHFEPGGDEAFYMIQPDWSATTVSVEGVRDWLRTRGFASAFFFPYGTGAADYLNPRDPCYSPKMAAAIGAWQAVKADSSLTRTKSVKNALVVWLNKHAAKYSLTKDDGTPNKQAIEEVSKIANWDTKGGAPKTPDELDPPF